MAYLLNKAKQATQSVQDAAAHTYANAPSMGTPSKWGLGAAYDNAAAALGLKDPALDHPHESSAPITEGNNVKFHIAGAAYFWAISEALESAKTSIWIHGWWVSPELHLRRPPSQNEHYRLDRMLTAAAERGVKVNIIIYKEMPNTIHLESKHTKHALEACHTNIQVFRHPDFYVSPKENTSAISTLAQDMMKGNIGVDGLKNFTDDQVEKAIAMASLPVPGWTHHDKMCIVDGNVAFMGGMDLCYGRWDLIQHPIADVHPNDPEGTVYPGQDYNNGRLKDFANLTNWEENKLNRHKSPRMGWEDVSFSVTGPVLADICAHFLHRWNFLYDKKYNTWVDSRYTRLTPGSLTGQPTQGSSTGPSEPAENSEVPRPSITPTGTVRCQFLRSASRWSNGTPTEHSIYNAYIEAINNSEHFIYIENQFFVTKSSTLPLTVWNKIGEALANRIIRAAKAGQKFKVIVVMPSVTIYPGELADPRAFPARLTMKQNYHSINHGLLHPNIYSTIKAAGFEPMDYIRFYNLRTYDRINSGGASNQYDTVSPSYFTAKGARLKDLPPWTGDVDSELDAYVSEQLYVHSKVMIVDDRIVICGSANLNDRSMKGTRDSEVALYIEDTEKLASKMDGKTYQAGKLAAVWRRYLMRKHMGRLEPQDMTKPDDNFHPSPAPNPYPFGDFWDSLVEDPLSYDMELLWGDVAKGNTKLFWKVFEPTPDNSIHTWAGFDAQMAKRLLQSSSWGHVIKSNFASGKEGAEQVKAELNNVVGMLVEMPMDFLKDDDIELVWWNPLTEIVTA